MDKPGFRRLMAYPWPALLVGQAIILASFMTLVWVTLLRHERDASVRLRADIARCERQVDDYRRLRATVPTRVQWDRDIQHMSRQLAMYDSLRQDPGAVIAMLQPDNTGTFGWQMREHHGDGSAARDWIISVTTDYASLNAMMRKLAVHRGGRTVRALHIARSDRHLQVEFTLAQSLDDGGRYE
ncbi:hypothetical protein SJI19_10130 [Acerihabitans sp. TG2]|uniref:hypothetical protein n=1 Tax=Acerihabitans sp. TG2 TaxID=3096008 RepID=UPI002B230350|nr:hypothetical protein [Acerihabitans sp. TG2]MEA9390897.1 hypothetical protein [Acerihabitans sp. TG2]